MLEPFPTVSVVVSGPLDRLFAGGLLKSAEPLQLTLAVEESSQAPAVHCKIEVTEVLRFLPGRRLVCAALLDDVPVVCKWFLGSGASRYRQRELAGQHLLREARLPTPTILRSFDYSLEERADADSTGCALVFEYLHGAEVLRDEHLRREPELYSQLFRLLALMHRAGVVHNDLHFGNLMYRPNSPGRIEAIAGESNSLWLIDSDAVTRASPSALELSESVEQFVRLATQTRSPLSYSELQSHWQSYSLDREFSCEAYAFDLIAKRYRLARRQRLVHFQAKMRRNCSAVAHRRTISGQALLNRGWLGDLGDQETIGREMLAWLDALPRLMQERDEQAGAVIKDGNTATVVAASFRDQALIVKRYNNKSLSHRLRRLFRPDRGLNSWVFAHTLEFTGIATAPAVALLRTRFAGPTYLVMQKVAGVELDPARLDGSADTFAQLSQQLAGLLDALAAEGLVHHDTKTSNFLWDQTNKALTLIDLDAMTLPASGRAASSGHERDRLRLLRNFAATPDLQRRLGSVLGNGSG